MDALQHRDVEDTSAASAFCNLNVDFSDARRTGHKSRKIYPAISPAACAVAKKKHGQRDVAISEDFTFYHVDWRQASYTADFEANVYMCVFVRVNVCVLTRGSRDEYRVRRASARDVNASDSRIRNIIKPVGASICN